MTIVYRDALGTVAIWIEEPTGIAFCNGCCYFSDDNGNDYIIEMADIVEILNYRETF